MGIFFSMDSWYDIVKSYDDPKNKTQTEKMMAHIPNFLL